MQIAAAMFAGQLKKVFTVIGGFIMSKKVSSSYVIIIGLMLFALFFEQEISFSRLCLVKWLEQMYGSQMLAS